MVKKIERYCEKCGKKTEHYLKIAVFNASSHKMEKARSWDICENCASRDFPILNKSKRAGMQKI